MPHTSLVTLDRPHFLALKSGNADTSTSVAPYTPKYATSTQPTSGSGSIVVPGAINVMKILPRFTNAGTSPSLRVIGWSLCTDTRLWLPHLLADVTCTLDTTAANGATINGTASMFAPHTITLNQGNSVNIYNTGSTTVASCAFFVVDTLGFDNIELAFRTTTASAKANAHIGEI